MLIIWPMTKNTKNRRRNKIALKEHTKAINYANSFNKEVSYIYGIDLKKEVFNNDINLMSKKLKEIDRKNFNNAYKNIVPLGKQLEECKRLGYHFYEAGTYKKYDATKDKKWDNKRKPLIGAFRNMHFGILNNIWVIRTFLIKSDAVTSRRI